MSVPVELPQPFEQLVDANGRLTLAGVIYITRLVKAIEDLQARVAALEP